VPKIDKTRKATPDLYEALAKPEGERHSSLIEVVKDWEERLRPRHPRWIQQVKFVEGEQWGFFNRKTWDWVTHSVARSEVRESRVVLNFMQGTIQQIRAVMTREMPIFGGYASNSDSIDAASSRYTDALIKYIWRKHSLRDMYGDVVEFAATTGTHYVEPLWNTSAGRPVNASVAEIVAPEFEERPNPETGIPEYTMTKEPEIKYNVEPEGDLEFRTYSVFEVINAPGSSLHNPGEAMVTVTDMRLAQLQDLYGDAADGIFPNAGPDESGASEIHRLRTMEAGIYSNASTNEYAESVRVYRMFVRSSAKYRRGMEIHFTDKAVLWKGDNPVYPTEEEEGEQWPSYHFPIFTFRHYVRIASFHGKAVAQDLTGPQLQLNGSASKEIKILKDHAHPRLRVPIGSKVDLSNRTDAIIEYSPRFGPEEVSYLKPGDMPSSLGDLVERYRGYMEIIGGVAGMNRSYAEDSGRKLQLMQQTDMGKLGPIKVRHDETWGMAIHHACVLWKRHATNERKVIVVGENLSIDLIAFNEGSITGSMDVVVHNDQSLPQNPEARQLAIQNIIQSTQGLEEVEKASAYELYGVKDFMKIEASKWADRNRAREENILMTRGDDIQVQFWENDDQHNAEHVYEMNTTSWRAKVQEEASEFDGDLSQSPTYQRFVAHITQHNESKQRKMAPAMPPGQPVPGGAPPQAAPAAQTGAPQPGG